MVTCPSLERIRASLVGWETGGECASLGSRGVATAIGGGGRRTLREHLDDENSIVVIAVIERTHLSVRHSPPSASWDPPLSSIALIAFDFPCSRNEADAAIVPILVPRL
jgi:hypothetical protein